MVDDALPAGAYSELVTEATEALLAIGDRRSRALVAGLRDADAGDRLGIHIASLVARIVGELSDSVRAVRRSGGARASDRCLGRVRTFRRSSSAIRLAPPPRVLEGIRARRPDGELAPLELPLTPLLDTTVLTNARGEPAIQHELAAEIPSAIGIDIVMAFVRWSGVRPLLPALRRHCDEGRRVRLITTTYTNSTEARALDELAAIGVDVRVSYDTTTTRLHAKAWLFHRHRGATTAYIGSSNLTHSAQVTGLEWNVRVSGLRNPDVVSKMAAVFESYWESDDFVPYDRAEFVERTELADRRRAVVRAAADGDPPASVSGAAARADRGRSAPRPAPQPARRRDRHRQDGHGGGRLRTTAVDAAAGAAAVRGAPAGDPGAEPGDVPTCAPRCELR